MAVIVAVSGGVDSAVLLHMLVNGTLPGFGTPMPDSRLIVAHFDHGIRPDSAADAGFVRQLAAGHGLTFELGKGQLGKDASESTARRARYDFLGEIQKKHGSGKIVTAHHQDDEIETAIINLLRGTGHRGLAPMRQNKNIHRPLLDTPKADLYRYAEVHNLVWREDASNNDPAYLRNYVRQHIMPSLADGSASRREFLEKITFSAATASAIDSHFESEPFDAASATLPRQTLIYMPVAVSSELIAYWLRSNGVKNFDRKTISRLLVAARTGRPATSQQVSGKARVVISRTHFKLDS